MFPTEFEIIDISQPVNSRTACFPGDVPFSKSLTVSYKESRLINLTCITLSPHVGTHAESSSHIQGDIEETDTNIGAAPLAPYVGRAIVLDFSPMKNGAVTAQMIKERLRAMSDAVGTVSAAGTLGEVGTVSAAGSAGTPGANGPELPPRVLLKTQRSINYESWAGDYPYIGIDAADYLHSQGVQLVGIDTPSVDQVSAKELNTHHVLNNHGMFWLENLDLTTAQPGYYLLVAAPLRFTEVEASPVRALLLK